MEKSIGVKNKTGTVFPLKEHDYVKLIEAGPYYGAIMHVRKLGLFEGEYTRVSLQALNEKDEIYSYVNIIDRFATAEEVLYATKKTINKDSIVSIMEQGFATKVNVSRLKNKQDSLTIEKALELNYFSPEIPLGMALEFVDKWNKSNIDFNQKTEAIMEEMMLKIKSVLGEKAILTSLQKEKVQEIYNTLRESDFGFINFTTGSGKTLAVSMFSKQYSQAGKCILFLTDKREMEDQYKSMFKKIGFNSNHDNRFNGIGCATVFSNIQEINEVKHNFDLIVIDMNHYGPVSRINNLLKIGRRFSKAKILFV